MSEKAIERQNFYHLVADIAWFGLALAATTRFLSVYAIRLGATPTELGLLAALPGLVLVISTALSGWWRRRFADSVRAIALPSLGFRLVFLLPAFAPFFPPEFQIMWLILAVAIPAIPQGIAGVIFIVLLRESVNDKRINSLMSRRHLAMNVALIFSALAFGLMLERVAFPLNYQIMFALAFVFTLMSEWHVLKVKVLYPVPTPAPIKTIENAMKRVWAMPSFQNVAFIALVIHLAFFSIVAVVPLFLMDHLGAGEAFMALFGVVELVAGAIIASFTDKIISRIGTRNTIMLAMFGTTLAALSFATAPTLEFTLIGAAISGASWTAANVGLFGYFMDSTPTEDLSRATVAYQQIISIAVFIGPLMGSTLIEGGINIVMAILIGAVMRFVAGFLTQVNLNSINIVRKRGLRLGT